MWSLVLVAASSAACSEPRAVPGPEQGRAQVVPTQRPIDAGTNVVARAFPDLGAAIAEIVSEEKPRVLGFGEVHQLVSNKGTRSALSRFTEFVVPALAERNASNLVLETWVERPSCGEVQKKVDTQVRKTTERPVTTQSELVLLLQAVDQRGIGRHGMGMSCTEYESLLGDAGAVDYSRLLSLITAKLRSKTEEVVKASPSDSIVFVYGGALHNEMHPNEGVAVWSYASAVDQAANGRYVEVDIFVPELILEDAALSKEPWFHKIRSPELDESVLLIRRAERSYVVLARRGVASKSAETTTKPSPPPQ